jgi:AcrR family transcriptional regulator
MRTRKLATEVRRDQIAAAALQIIAAHGVRGLSLAAVARRVGLVPSAIYRHFAGKDEILDATLDHLGARLHGNLGLAAGAAGDPIDRLHELLARHVRLIRENQAIPQIIFSEEVYGGRSDRKAKVRAIITGYLDGVAEIVREGQAKGRIRPDIEPQVGAVGFLGLVQPAAILWHLSDGGFDVTRHTERAWRIYRAGIEMPGPGTMKRRTARSPGARGGRGGPR